MLRARFVFASISVALLYGFSAIAQVVTGSAVGSIADSSGSVVPGVALKLVSDATGAVREAASDGTGTFNFNAMPPGMYTLHVEHAGFKALRKTGIALMANERLSLGQIRLEIGAVGESVTVTGTGETVQTASSDRSDVIRTNRSPT